MRPPLSFNTLGVREMIVREATPEDIPQLVKLRMQLFAEVGEIESLASSPALRDATEAFFAHAIANGSSKSWLADADGTVVATGTLAVFCRPPYPGNISGREAYLLNMYTMPAYRRKGLATQLLNLITEYAKSQDFGKVWLHASPEGRPLYERFGFVSNPAAMEWVLS